MNVNQNIFPKSGYRFKEADGTVIVGNNWAGVIARVRLYRKRAGLPPGDPKSEVLDYACKTNPSLCIQDDGGITARATTEVSLKGRVMKWFSDIQQRNLGFVDDATAKARAEVCKQCPNSVALPEGCANCRRVLAELRRKVLGRGRTGSAAITHHGCTVLGSEPATEVWIDEPTMDNPELPAHCWKKRVIT